MTLDANLGPELESTVDHLVRSGRFRSADDVLREGVRLVEAREKQRRELMESLERGVAQIEAGQGIPAEEAFVQLKARYATRG